ncbi:hypothetical protein L9F63_010073 [Diploptera punctata]|uniref:CUB domain-containing protein n=1 Tax=Diploptera punctata TaxID=6984 RepID=A0AAD8EQZ3_DIPPU|nr:hypothetical protein L9F63_010073 [Diploptera punctata]
MAEEQEHVSTLMSVGYRMGEHMVHVPLVLGSVVYLQQVVVAEVFNNVTYFVSPSFPTLSRDISDCTLRIQKVDPSISQIRLDFNHFNMGQPNRRTGVCDSDYFMMTGGSGQDIKLCGQNSGQHVYYDVENINDTIVIIMNMTDDNLYRMWEIKISQIEFNQRAPAGCRQYFQGSNGKFSSFPLNFNTTMTIICTLNWATSIMFSQTKITEVVLLLRILAIAHDPGSGGGPIEENRECDDKIVMPCDSEEFIMPGDGGGPGVCDLFHCGSSFCTQGETPCRIESSTTPFNIRIQFGPGTKDESPEDNIGMCLRYEQLPCSV